MADPISDLVALPDEEQWLSALPVLVASEGVDKISQWRDATKHKHRLVHVATVKDYTRVLELLLAAGFDLNAQRDSDQCTALHLAIFYKKPRTASLLKKLGVDTTLQNSYGESCDAKYEKLAETMQNIIWLDLELTSGFYDSTPARILEAAIIITDKDLNELGRGQWVINGFCAEELLALADFHQKTFRDREPGGAFPPLADTPGNGLFSEIVASTVTKEAAQEQMLRLMKKHCVEHACPIAGNSIQCDREVLMLEMPQVYSFLNHRILDVSSFTGLMERWLPDSLAAWKLAAAAEASAGGAVYNHRAINDIESSISTMRWVRSNMLVQPALVQTAVPAAVSLAEPE